MVSEGEEFSRDLILANSGGEYGYENFIYHFGIMCDDSLILEKKVLRGRKR